MLTWLSATATAATRATVGSHAVQTRRNRFPEGQEGMGNCPRAVETTAHERDNDVLFRQQSADFQYHDGIYAVQGPHPGSDQHECRLCQVRHGRDTWEVAGREGSVCVDAVWAVGVGGVEG